MRVTGTVKKTDCQAPLAWMHAKIDLEGYTPALPNSPSSDWNRTERRDSGVVKCNTLHHFGFFHIRPNRSHKTTVCLRIDPWDDGECRVVEEHDPNALTMVPGFPLHRHPAICRTAPSV